MNDAMNDIFEIWSLPWHALQRHLAESFWAQSPPPSKEKPGSAADPACGASWLARALCPGPARMR